MAESFLSDSPYSYTRRSYISRPSPMEVRTTTYTRPSHVYSSSAYYPSYSRYYDYAYDYVGRPVTSVSTTYHSTTPYYYSSYHYPVSYANAASYPTRTYETTTYSSPSYEVKKEVSYSPRLSTASTLASPLRSSTVIETTYKTQSPLRRSHVYRSLYPTTASPLWSEYKYGRPWRFYSYPRYQTHYYSRPYTSTTYTYESPTYYSRSVPSYTTYTEYHRPTVVESTSVTYRDDLPRDTYDPLTGTSKYVTKDYLNNKTIETTVSPTRAETKVYDSAGIDSRYETVVRRSYVY